MTIRVEAVEFDKSPECLIFSLDNERWSLEGFKQSRLKSAFTYIGYVLSLGILWLVGRWYPQFRLKLTHRRVPLVCASELAAINQNGKLYICVPHEFSTTQVAKFCPHLSDCDQSTVAVFYLMERRFILLEDQVVELTGIDHQTHENIFAMSNAIHSTKSTQFAKELFGANMIGVDIPGVVKIFYEEVLSPFYIFQLFSILLWMTFEYYMYASSIVLITTVSIVMIIFQIRRERRKLAHMVAQGQCFKVNVVREQQFNEEEASNLVPGDVISIEPNMTVPADCVLISGEVRVDEAMLTGEAMAMVKTAIQSNESTLEVDKSRLHVLYGGTKVLLTRSSGVTTRAVIVRTGYNSARGCLVQSILFPKPINVKFERDGLKFIGIMAVLGLFGFVYSVVITLYGCLSAWDTIAKSLDLVTTIVPPALPAALSVGIVYAQQRLKKLQIFTIQPGRINLAGAVNMAMFDKTGTLTVDGLDLIGVLENCDDMTYGLKVAVKNESILHAMAACHSLDTYEDRLIGDPLEIEIFNKIGATLNIDKAASVDETPNFISVGENKIYQLKQYPFSSDLARASTLAKVMNQKGQTSSAQLFTKGAPEVIVRLCTPESLPQNLMTVHDKLTKKGHRILALAYRQFDSQLHKILRLKRDEVESNLVFLGLLIFNNNVKSDTSAVLSELKEANIRVGMITGDNLMTAVAVADEVGITRSQSIKLRPRIIDQVLKWVDVDMNAVTSLNLHSEDIEIAITGDEFRYIKNEHPDLINQILVKTSVFARMKPDDKADVIDHYEKIGFVTTFCGDGANDCAALKRASVGMSLSDLEASVASPFTSAINSIQSVSSIIKEGRCALVTSYGVFRYMVMYSFIQFVTSLIAYWRQTMMSDLQFLFIDLIIVDIFALTATRTGARTKLHSKPPPQRIITAGTITGILLQLLTMTTFLTSIYLWTINQTWFCSISDDLPDCFERNTTTGAIVRALEAEKRCPNGQCVNDVPKLVWQCDDKDWGENTDSDAERRWFVEHYVVQTLFISSMFMYISSAVIYSGPGQGHKKSMWTNWLFVCAIAVLLGISLCITFLDAEWIDKWFEFTYPYWTQDMRKDNGTEPLYLPSIPKANDALYGSTRGILVAFASGYTIVAVLIEVCVTNNDGLWEWIDGKFRADSSRLKQYELVEKECTTWPPVSSSKVV